MPTSESPNGLRNKTKQQLIAETQSCRVSESQASVYTVQITRFGYSAKLRNAGYCLSYFFG